MRQLAERLKQRKLVQWTLAYLAGGWLLLQLADVLEEPLGISAGIQRGLLVVLAAGLVVTLVLAWYHGEQGRQRASGPELVIIASLLGIGAIALTFVGRDDAEPAVGAAGDAPARAQRDRPAVAVLPFENLSPDPDNAYFADGMHEQIISQLGEISGLIVIARTTVMRYADAPAPVREIARELGVDYVLEGSARKSGDRVRLTAQLIEGGTEEQLWAEDYDRDLTVEDLFEIQDDVAGRVAATMSATILPSEASRMGERPTASLEAYERFLKGNYHLSQRTQASFQSAVAEFEASSAADPAFVEPVSRLGYTYAMLLGWGFNYPGLSRDSLLTLGLEAVNRAIREDPENSDAWMARGFLSTTANAETYEGVVEALERAITLDRENAEAHHIYGWALGVLGRAEEAITHLEHALSLEPGRLISLSSMAELSLREHRLDESKRWADSALAVDAGYWFAYTWRARARLQMGQIEEAGRDAELALRMSGGETVPALTAMAMAAAAMGDTAGARALIERATGSDAEPVTIGRFVAMPLVVLGEEAGALELLESLRPRGVLLRATLRMPEFDPIRDDPRFQALLENREPN